ncbi:MAG: hypothetical protein CVV25_13460 [Ignavibacteriae bacterium HGW-Ignavibacteriae-4]|nr:MAG: hypothetical protein CVV25_13460 [Ignavibacteriae bacterium HGW-Ignavibacteriae-4]
MTTTKTYTLVFALTLIFWTNLEAQVYELSTPLAPSVNSLAEESIGGFIGIGPNWAGGKHFVECDSCEFQDGTATGYTIGGIYQRKASTNFFFGAIMSLDIMNINSTYREIEPIDISQFSGFSNEQKPINIDFRHEAKMNITYLGIAPFIAYNPTGWLTFRVAPKISFPLYSNLVHTKTPLTKNVFVNGVEGRLRYTDADTKVQDSKVSELTSPLIGSDFSLLLNLTPGERSTFSIGYTQNVPFTNTSSFGENFSINSWRIFVEFKYTIQKAYDLRPKSAKK